MSVAPPDRQALLADTALTGRSWCEAWTSSVDRWLRDLFAVAVEGVEGVDGGGDHAALVAVGGYGRGELCPQSDIDVLLLHDGAFDVAGVAERLWYPIWDTNLKLGHGVRTVREALSLAEGDLNTATSLLDVRLLAGSERLADELGGRAVQQWQRRAKRWLVALGSSVDERHRRYGEVAYLLEPDLKEGRGGLHDVHTLRWAELARRIIFDADVAEIDAAYDVLLDARVELHRLTGRPTDQLTLQEQDGVAEAVGDADADVLMSRVSAAARTVAWTGDDTWARVRSSLSGPLGRIPRRDRRLADGVVLREGEVHLEAAADPAQDPVLALRAGALAAGLGVAIDRSSLERLARGTAPMPSPWPAEARERFVELLRAGAAARGVIEAFDRRGLWVRVLPEWSAVRCRPQRNAYHRFTVDRHLVETATNAAALADDVDRPDLLVVGALLHDLGKGWPGDHTEAGVRLVRVIGARMGYPPADVAVLVAMVDHHLLLPDVATRRDLDEPTTIQTVAEAVASPRVLALLAALTEADSLATGPAAWGTWKADLVRQLVARVQHVLGGGDAGAMVSDAFPTSAQRALMAAGERVITGDGETLVVVAPDRPGLFSRVTGVLALHGLGVLAAWADSDDDGMAVEQFRVESSTGPVIAWERVCADVELALDGRLAVQARLEERARRYVRRVPVAATPAVTKVTFENGASALATVVEVQAPDAIGVLYRITRSLAEMDLDIRRALVQTIGPQVVDAFYVRDASGGKLTDEAQLAELERALVHAIEDSGPERPPG